MHPVRKQRLQIVFFILLATALAVGFLMYALRDNINLFYPPSDVAEGKVPFDKNIRLGGMVMPGSIQRSKGSLDIRFTVTDYAEQVNVEYTGILPDLFDEGQGVVATGKLLATGVFQASEILAKHDENYMPPEVAETLKKAPGKDGA
ncbi:MAG: cytochrome c maturation protein CcmE [Pseudomonadales bacterium]